MPEEATRRVSFKAEKTPRRRFRALSLCSGIFCSAAQAPNLPNLPPPNRKPCTLCPPGPQSLKPQALHLDQKRPQACQTEIVNPQSLSPNPQMQKNPQAVNTSVNPEPTKPSWKPLLLKLQYQPRSMATCSMKASRMPFGA